MSAGAWFTLWALAQVGAAVGLFLVVVGYTLVQNQTPWDRGV